ncbi:MAG: hypothetical protein MHPSP_001230, partial [Paramarteilia canceri]
SVPSSAPFTSESSQYGFSRNVFADEESTADSKISMTNKNSSHHLYKKYMKNLFSKKFEEGAAYLTKGEVTYISQNFNVAEGKIW